MYIIMELLSEYVQAEWATSNGMIYLLLQTKDYIHIIEVNIDNAEDETLHQIKGKGMQIRLWMIQDSSSKSMQVSIPRRGVSRLNKTGWKLGLIYVANRCPILFYM